MPVNARPFASMESAEKLDAVLQAKWRGEIDSKECVKRFKEILRADPLSKTPDDTAEILEIYAKNITWTDQYRPVYEIQSQSHKGSA